jgi:predicted dehydrogenase
MCLPEIRRKKDTFAHNIMKKVRIGIIGMGNMGKHHAEYLMAGKVDRCKLTAICSTSPKKLEIYKEKGLEIFGNGQELIESKDVDAVVIATPHFQHTILGIAAMEAGKHVMVEKPISAHKADAERLIATRKKFPDLVFAAMFQLRTENRYLKIKKLITDGHLGEIVRFSWIVTDWYRTEAYYASGGWRATWIGEGGGVLINQCLHQLDILQWLLGMPARVRSFVQLSRFHNIEVEDNVTSYLEFSNKATGVFIASTGEAPGTNRLEIAGTLGKLVLENDKLTFIRNEVSMIEHCQTAKLGFSKPETWNVDVPITTAPAQHATIMQNFVDAILDGTPLICPGEEGIHSIELANVMLYSGLINETMELPMDGVAYRAKLMQMIAGSTVEKNIAEISSEDFTMSFTR